MFKQLAERLFTSKPIGRKEYEHINTIRLFHGEVMEHTDADVLVSFVTPDLSLGGPLNKAFLAQAGEELGDYIAENIIHPRAGEAFLVPAFNMPMKNIMLLVLPKWEDGLQNEDRQMLRCYRRAIRLAQEQGLKSIAFPALGFGRLNFPHIRFARLAVKGVLETLDARMDDVRVVCKERGMTDIYAQNLKKMGWSG